MSTRATPYAKVEPQMAVMSVHMRSTSMSRLQFSHAFGPMKWKSGGRRRLSMPAPQKLPSGRARDLLLLAMAKVTDVSVRQPSKANGPICAPGANAATERAAFCKDPPTKLNTPWGCDLSKRIASLKDPILETDDRGRQLNNL